MKQQRHELRMDNAKECATTARIFLEKGMSEDNLECLMEALNHINRTIGLLEWREKK